MRGSATTQKETAGGYHDSRTVINPRTLSALGLAASLLASCAPVTININTGQGTISPTAGFGDGGVPMPIALPTARPTEGQYPGVTNYCVFEKKTDGRTIIPQAVLTLLDGLKQNGYPVDQWNQWAEVGTFNGAEVTAGDNRQASVALDLWRRDGKTPWGNAEVKTIVRLGVKPNSVGLKEGFSGTGWVYPQDIQGKGWNDQLVACDSAAGVGRRIQAKENIADAMVIPYGDGQYILVNSQRIPLNNASGKPAWIGTIDARDKDIAGVRGIVPLRVLVDLGLVVDRHP